VQSTVGRNDGALGRVSVACRVTAKSYARELLLKVLKRTIHDRGRMTMKTFIIMLGALLLLSGAACTRDPYDQQPRREGTYQKQPQNTNTGKQEKKGIDPYESRYGDQTNRPRY